MSTNLLPLAAETSSAANQICNQICNLISQPANFLRTKPSIAKLRIISQRHNPSPATTEPTVPPSVNCATATIANPCTAVSQASMTPRVTHTPQHKQPRNRRCPSTSKLATAEPYYTGNMLTARFANPPNHTSRAGTQLPRDVTPNNNTSRQASPLDSVVSASK